MEPLFQNSFRDIDVMNTDIAFGNKSLKEIKRAQLLFSVMHRPVTAKILTTLLLAGIKLRLPMKSLIRKTIFTQFCGGESVEESEQVVNELYRFNIKTILDYSVEGHAHDEDFRQTRNEVQKIMQLGKNNNAIPYTSLKLTAMARPALLAKVSAQEQLAPKEIIEWTRVKDRTDLLCVTAKATGIPLFFDAEESWIQGAIDELALEMMRKYNREKHIVLTTVQMYRKDRLSYLKGLLKAARDEGFYIGTKLVRGAYWEKEVEYAGKRNIQPAVHEQKSHTDKDFDEAIDLCMDNLDITFICAATHNENSTFHLIKKMDQMQVPVNHPNIYFSQLYGMSDHISFNVASCGYNVTKYVPYGPVKSVVPYLIRRAEENTSVAGQANRELFLLKKELMRRTASKIISNHDARHANI